MIDQKQYLLTTPTRTEGIVYCYSDKGFLCGLEIKERLFQTTTQWVIDNLKATEDDFLEWVKGNKTYVVVQLQQKITFDMFWNKYNDKMRSSKKRSEKLWCKLTESDQVKAFYYYDTYNRNRGSAEKKYCETYLGAEMWNN